MENQRARLPRDYRAWPYGIGLLILALTIFLILHFGLRQYIDQYLNELYARKTKVPAVGDFGSAGEYFNIVIGVPLAFLGVLIAVAASIILAQFALTKDDIAIFTFVENLMRPVTKRIRGLVEAFIKLLAVGNQCDELMWRVHKAISASEPGSHAPDARIIDRLTRAQREEFLSEMRSYLESITANLEDWTRQYEQLLGTMYGVLFAHEKIHAALAAKPWGTANSYLRVTLPPLFLKRLGLAGDLETASRASVRRHKNLRAKKDSRDPEEHSNDVRQILSYLATDNMKTEDALERFFAAAYLLPTNSTTLEFVGLAIYPFKFILEKPQRRPLHGVTIHGYLINMGAAQLATLYQYIPDRSAIETALNRIFERRSKAAEKLLEFAAPTPRDFTLFKVDDSICELIDHPERIIIVLVEREKGIISGETYNRSHHGEIPATGYKSEHSDE
ncbi:MAG: hypothetical protein P4L57_02310 [Rhizomicrobium sp.]|nr:hypothetical protein [Rhizomicrobium sp.]